MGFEKDSFFTMVKHSNPAKSLTLSAKILGSCNGLICLTSEKLTLMLFNPCTGNFNVIPDTVLKDYSGGCYGKYGKIALPSYEDEGIYWTLGVSRGYLVACCNYKPKKADMWIMKEYGVEKSWTKLVTMSLPVDRRDSVLPLFVTENGDEVLLQLGAEVTQYNSRNASFKRLDDFMSGDFRQVQMATYFESLASPHI
uniref:F-box/kelch-repeat protein At3g06240-like n=1 Tax=Nicotiana tabacum TaxID=4097 RepID=A0A1S4BCG4_TOBAC|nr:PREDICTED: uncharacterized protein LOC107806826 [Nicotiana tabacum]